MRTIRSIVAVALLGLFGSCAGMSQTDTDLIYQDLIDINELVSTRLGEEGKAYSEVVTTMLVAWRDSDAKFNWNTAFETLELLEPNVRSALIDNGARLEDVDFYFTGANIILRRIKAAINNAATQAESQPTQT